MASNFLCPFEPGTSKSLGIKKFKLDPNAKTIREKLSPDQNDGNKKSKKQKTLKPIVKNQKYYLGSNNHLSDVSEAAEFLLKRDYPRIAEITESYAGQSVQIFVPQSWLSKVPTVVNTEDFATKQENVKSLPGDVEKDWIGVGNQLKGELPEKELYDELREYFLKKEEEVVVLHDSELLELDLEKRKKHDKLIQDFIIINNTHQYVMNIEVRKTLNKKTINHACDQLDGSKRLLEDYFEADIQDSWTFISAVYCWEMKEPSCPPCSDFIMVQRKEVQQKIEKMIGMLMESRPNPVPSPMVFRTLVKYILFCASAIPAPITSNMGARVAENVEKAGTAPNIALWSFWTPEQKSLMCADNLPHVAFISSFSTGKTKCLQRRAFEIARNARVLFVICNSTKKKTLLQLTMENTVNKDESLKKNMILKNIDQKSDHTDLVEPLRNLIIEYPNHHLFIDELVLPKPSEHSKISTGLQQIRAELTYMWLAVAGIEEGKAEHFTKDYMQSVFPCFHIPVLRYPLRSTRKIVETAIKDKNNKLVFVTGLMKSKVDIEFPDNLVEGIEPDILEYKYGDEKLKLREAVEIVNNTEGKKGVAILCDYSGDITTICQVVEEAGRPKPLVYSSRDWGVPSCTEAEAAAWLEKSLQGTQTTDILTDREMSRGWECQTVVVVMDEERDSAFVNLAMRAQSRLIIVKPREVNEKILKTANNGDYNSLQILLEDVRVNLDIEGMLEDIQRGLGKDESAIVNQLFQRARMKKLKLDMLDDWRNSEPETDLKTFMNELIISFGVDTIEDLLKLDTPTANIARIIIYYLLPSVRESIQFLTPNFPLQRFKSRGSVNTYIHDIIVSGISEKNSTRVVIVGNQGSGKTSLARALSNFLDTANEEPFLTKDHPDLLETKLVDIIENKRTTESFLATKSSLKMKDSDQESSIMTVNFETDVVKSERIFNIYDAGGHMQYFLSHAILKASSSTYIVAFDGSQFHCDLYYPRIGVYLEQICKTVNNPAILLCSTKCDQQENTNRNKENMLEVVKTAQRHVYNKFNKSKVIIGNKVIMTSAATVGQLSTSTSMSDLVKYINGLTDMAAEHGKMYVPQSWETFVSNLKKTGCTTMNMADVINHLPTSVVSMEKVNFEEKENVNTKKKHIEHIFQLFKAYEEGVKIEDQVLVIASQPENEHDEKNENKDENEYVDGEKEEDGNKEDEIERIFDEDGEDENVSVENEIEYENDKVKDEPEDEQHKDPRWDHMIQILQFYVDIGIFLKYEELVIEPTSFIENIVFLIRHDLENQLLIRYQEDILKTILENAIHMDYMKKALPQKVSQIFKVGLLSSDMFKTLYEFNKNEKKGRVSCTPLDEDILKKFLFSLGIATETEKGQIFIPLLISGNQEHENEIKLKEIEWVENETKFHLHMKSETKSASDLFTILATKLITRTEFKLCYLKQLEEWKREGLVAGIIGESEDLGIKEYLIVQKTVANDDNRYTYYNTLDIYFGNETNDGQTVQKIVDYFREITDECFGNEIQSKVIIRLQKKKQGKHLDIGKELQNEEISLNIPLKKASIHLILEYNNPVHKLGFWEWFLKQADNDNEWLNFIFEESGLGINEHMNVWIYVGKIIECKLDEECMALLYSVGNPSGQNLINHKQFSNYFYGKLGKNVLHFTLENNFEKSSSEILKWDPKLIRTLLTQTNINGKTPIMTAILKGEKSEKEILEYLKNALDIDTYVGVDKTGNTVSLLSAHTLDEEEVTIAVLNSVMKASSEKVANFLYSNIRKKSNFSKSLSTFVSDNHYHNILYELAEKDMGNIVSLILQDLNPEDSWQLLMRRDNKNNTPLMHAAVLAKANALTSMLTFFLFKKDDKMINQMLHCIENGCKTLPYLIAHSTETLLAPQGIILQLETEFHMKGGNEQEGLMKVEDCLKLNQGASTETSSALKLLDKSKPPSTVSLWFSIIFKHGLFGLLIPLGLWIADISTDSILCENYYHNYTTLEYYSEQFENSTVNLNTLIDYQTEQFDKSTSSINISLEYLSEQFENSTLNINNIGYLQRQADNSTFAFYTPFENKPKTTTFINKTLESYPEKLSYRAKFFYSTFFVIIPFFFQAIASILWANYGLIAINQDQPIMSLIRKCWIIFSVPLLLFLWPAFQMLKSFKQQVKTLQSREHYRQEMNEKALQYEINKSYAHLMEVIIESSFQPLLQWYIVFPVVYDLLQDENKDPENGFLTKTAFNNLLQLSSWLISLFSLAWSFTSYNAAMKKGALSIDVNPIGRILIFFSNLCLIFVRMNFIIFFMYAWGPGQFYPGVIFIVVHVLMMGLLHIMFVSYGKISSTSNCIMFWKMAYSCLVNGLANIYCHNYVDTETEQTSRSFIQKRPSSFIRQGIFDIIFLAENISMAIIASLHIRINPFDDFHTRSQLFAVLFLIHFLGISLKIIYYKFFHIWKDVTTKFDFKTRSNFRGENKLDYKCSFPLLSDVNKKH